ncbi:intermembrane phospholipid transport protein YdbH family protein [Sphingomonas jatrophae]|uniref:Dicarboxylate transport n=1 Tax=Sphingomonas jatrophae TaxID=1166337 RepID=A0A1I6JJT2_9SPHN|nr:YdbH domain-containing protein [Sphingomonas jatrophae]SFR79288.1 Dicarboxylate transport [Sphingomonas jatrophae]
MDAAETNDIEVRRHGRWRLIAAGLFALLALALAALWSQRKPIATGFVDRALRERGVPARYRIAGLNVREQRLVDVSIGDPARPDLTADEVILRLSLGLSGPKLEAVQARGVRLYGKVVDGRVSLGAIDRLLPASDGSPFVLPELDVDLRDARMRLETPAGPLGLALDGRGRLDDGFRGSLALVSRDLKVAGCRSEGATAFLNVTISDRQPSVDGPVRVPSLDCGGTRVSGAQAAVDLRLSPALDRWDGGGQIELARFSGAGVSSEVISGRIGVSGGARGTEGEVQIQAARSSTRGIGMRNAAFAGRYRVGSGQVQLDGQVSTLDAALDPAARRSLAGWGGAAAGSPVGPLAQGLAVAADRAAAEFSAQAKLALVTGGGRGRILLSDLTLAARSGARIAGDGLRAGVVWPAGGFRMDGALTFGGGGLPAGRVALRQAPGGGPFSGEATIAPYAAGDARLALAPVRFTQEGGATRISTAIRLDGPLGDGRVEGLTLPLIGRLGARGGFTLNDACAPLGWSRLRISGAVAGPTRLRLCPSGRALLWQAPRGGVQGGGEIPGPRLTGTLGGSPLSLAATRLRFDVGRPGFTADALAVRLGAPERQSRLDVAQLTGIADRRGFAGRFAGLGGQIGAVPLILSDGQGPWRLAGGVLDLGGTLSVRDAADPARFEPLAADGVTLRLAGGQIKANGTLRAPADSTRIGEVTIRHDLSRGAGHATLDVPGITFTEALQPERLTRLTLGVIANVRGTLAGRGEIDWTADGVTSTGRFGTEAIDLAAAFGPVKGLKGEIVFTDLLGLVSAPDQVATVTEINPGIAVRDGTIRYRLLPDQQVAITSGRWPFSGGELLLEPTTLDFGRPSVRRMTFRVVGMDAAKFVEQFDFKNIAVTGVFDGTLPIAFGADGGRIERGRLAVRQGGGTLAYVGEISNEDLGMFGSLAFDALKRMRYDRLAIELDGSLDGEIVSRVLFDGTNETPKEAVRKNGLLSQFSNLPFRFNITIRAPFRGLLNSARALNDPRGLIEQARTPVTPLPGSSPAAPVQPR